MSTNHVDPEPVFALSRATIRAPAAVRAEISGFGLVRTAAQSQV
jgi:hypothetical protein